MNRLSLGFLFNTTDKVSLISTLIFVSLTLILTVFLLIFLNHLPPKLPLFYSYAWGENQLVQKEQLFILPAIMVLIGLINISLASQLHPAQLALKRMLILSTLTVSIIIFISYIKIITIFV